MIVIQVLSAIRAPISVRGRYFRRTARTNQRMSHEEIMQRMITSTGISWDSMIENTATLDDLNATKISTFVEGIKRKGRLSIPEQATDQDVLRKLELIKNNIPTRAALLLFGNNPESYFSSAFLKIGRFRSPTQIVDDREIHNTLIDQLDGAMSWFRERLKTEFVVTGKIERDVHWEYPLEAIREAITNALCHRDYTSLAHTQIKLYDDHLEIKNAGGLPPALTPEALFHEHDSIPRNQKIAESFFYAGFIERWGSGTLRMIEELQSAGFPPPRFISESGHFKLSFYKELFTDEFLKESNLSERQLKVINYIKEHGKITNTEYQAITNVSKRTATRELNELKEKGLLVSEGATTGRGIFYRFNMHGG